MTASGRTWLLAGLMLLGPGCLIEPISEENARLELQLEVPAVSRSQSALGSGPWDDQGLFHLDVFPKLVRVAVEVQDFELVSATWPSQERGIGEGETEAGAVSLTLEVPAGPGRILRALAFYWGDDVQVYRESQGIPLDLVAGQQQEVKLSMGPHSTGSAEVVVRCEEGNAGAWQPFQIRLVDARALVIQPVRDLLPDGDALKATYTSLPIGRAHWARIILKNSMQGQLRIIDYRKPTFTVASASETTAVNLVISCE